MERCELIMKELKEFKNNQSEILNENFTEQERKAVEIKTLLEEIKHNLKRKENAFHPNLSNFNFREDTIYTNLSSPEHEAVLH